LFGLVVTAYVVSVIGIPVFLHYCGGEIENVNFVVKGSTACCGEEEDAEPMDDGCCKDENLVVKNNTTFTFQKNTNNELVKSFCQLFFISLPLKNETFTPALNLEYLSIEAPPPKLQASLIISTSVLRI
jgi:hypothetical protein